MALNVVKRDNSTFVCCLTWLVLQESSTDGEINKESLETLKKFLKSMIVAPVENPSEKLDLIDAVQRLGVFYHFENEIEIVLQQIHDMLSCDSDNKKDDGELYFVALRFRLLRQQGYKVSCGKYIFHYITHDLSNVMHHYCLKVTING